MLKLAISNIAWKKEKDEAVYQLMKKYEFSGLEIAPTRIVSENPYDKNEEARAWAEDLKRTYGFQAPSMQSIWFGRQERMFGTKEEQNILLEYTKKAIDFAGEIQCKNLVFGCPRNRNLPEGADPETAIPFFKTLSEYAMEKGTVIGMEANPPIYNTNYVNDTLSAIELIERIDSPGFQLNLDTGTMLMNGESAADLEGKVHWINHVHISEPGLKPLEERGLHSELKRVLENENYQGFVSIEMSTLEEISVIEEKMEYVRRIFN